MAFSIKLLGLSALNTHVFRVKITSKESEKCTKKLAYALRQTFLVRKIPVLDNFLFLKACLRTTLELYYRKKSNFASNKEQPKNGTAKILSQRTIPLIKMAEIYFARTNSKSTTGFLNEQR